MKKVFAFLCIVALIACLFVVPSLAAPAPYVFTCPHIICSVASSTPDSEGFYPISYTSSIPASFRFTFSDVEAFESYDSSNEEYYFTVLMLFVDSSNNIIVCPSQNIGEFLNLDQYNASTGAYSGSYDSSLNPQSYFSLNIYDFDDGRRDYYFVLTVFGSDYLGDPDYSFLPVKVMFVPVLSSAISSSISVIKAAYNAPYSEESAYDNGYSSGYYDGTSIASSGSYSAGYSDGYGYGYDRGLSDGTESGYQDGYSNGEDYGYSVGYNLGFRAGETSNITQDAKSFILYTVSSPFIAIANFLDFNVLGINLRQIFAFVFSCAIFAWTMKHIL